MRSGQYDSVVSLRGNDNIKGFRDGAISLILAEVGFVTQIVDDFIGRNAAPSAMRPAAA